MSYKIAQSAINASTIDILNVIRQNATYDYQQNVPEVKKSSEIPRVGEIINGTPAFANQFINALVNRIGLVLVRSAIFNNPYRDLKKGMLSFGETVEDIFVNIAKVVHYDPEKGKEREFKRTLPDVRSAFHVMNWRAMYPTTIQRNDLRLAFLSDTGIIDMVAKINESMIRAAEYDEFLLFKYLLIKSISKGELHPVAVDSSDKTDSAKKFRGYSNAITFMSSDYNFSGVKNATPRENQVIFMDSLFNAEYDVDVLAAAFHMDKADFAGKLYLIDNFTTFDNERFSEIIQESDGIEPVTDEELALMKNVKAVLADKDWFQVYDVLYQMEDSRVASGLYWNYFLHIWKIVSSSPFANAIVFVDNSATIAAPVSITAEVVDKSIGEEAVVLSLLPQVGSATLSPHDVQFVQTDAATAAGIAVQKFGAILIPANQASTKLTLELVAGGESYKAADTIDSTAAVGTTLTFNKQ